MRCNAVLVSNRNGLNRQQLLRLTQKKTLRVPSFANFETLSSPSGPAAMGGGEDDVDDAGVGDSSHALHSTRGDFRRCYLCHLLQTVLAD